MDDAAVGGVVGAAAGSGPPQPVSGSRTSRAAQAGSDDRLGTGILSRPAADGWVRAPLSWFPVGSLGEPVYRIRWMPVDNWP